MTAAIVAFPLAAKSLLQTLGAPLVVVNLGFRDGCASALAFLAIAGLATAGAINAVVGRRPDPAGPARPRGDDISARAGQSGEGTPPPSRAAYAARLAWSLASAPTLPVLSGRYSKVDL